jgi:hypothetical protein
MQTEPAAQSTWAGAMVDTHAVAPSPQVTGETLLVARGAQLPPLGVVAVAPKLTLVPASIGHCDKMPTVVQVPSVKSRLEQYAVEEHAVTAERLV